MKRIQLNQKKLNIIIITLLFMTSIWAALITFKASNSYWLTLVVFLLVFGKSMDIVGIKQSR